MSLRRGNLFAALPERQSEEHVDLLVAKRFEHRRHVVANIGEVDLAITQLGAAVSVQVDRDHLPVLGQRRHDRLEHVGGAKPAM